MIGQLDKNYLKQKKWKIVKRLISYFLFEGRPLTTKGRWINILLFPFLRILSLFRLSTKKNNPVFIAGIGRSGTTYLGKVLSLYPNVSYLNEPKILWYIANDKDDINGNYDNSGNGQYFLQKAAHKTKKKINNLYSNYLFFTNGKYVLDKYPEIIFRLDYAQEIFDDFKVILIIRNGWDTITSIGLWSSRLGKYEGSTEDWWGKDNLKWKLLIEQVAPKSQYFKESIDQIITIEDHEHRAAVEYILTMEYALKMRSKFKDNILLIKYEDFSDSPEINLKKIEDFIGWTASTNVYQYVKSSASKSKYVARPTLPDFILEAFNDINNSLYPENQH